MGPKIRFWSFCWTFFHFFLFLPKKVILDPERSKIINVQKWCQNGSMAIIKGVVSKSRFLKNQSRIYVCQFEKNGFLYVFLGLTWIYYRNF